MKKTVLMGITLLALLASITSETQNFETAKANWIPLSPKVPPPLPPTMVVDSPQNRTYNEKDLSVRFHIEGSLRSGRPAEPIFSMPKEYINYTITTRGGITWAAVDGNYPIYCANAASVNAVTMLYPTPPGTTNILITLNGTQLAWRNYTEQHPTALHHTTLGDWPMIATTFTPSELFVLAIHYEHPIKAVNESYQFLYDLNIAPYLSASNPTSTAHFTLKIYNELSGLRVFTVSDDNRKEVEFTIGNAYGVQTVKFTVTSEYGKSLVGDVLVTFSNSGTQVECSSIMIVLTTCATITLLIVITVLVSAFLYRKIHFTSTGLL
ncbi:MAG: hypothetical protein ACQXXJ_03795 [Candidatus Bathyarchaeia archaeon]|jgi:hypothetical protein